MSQFKPPKITFTNSSTEALTIIFDQVKDRLNELIEDAEKLYQRSFLIVGTCITLLTAIIGYIFLNLAFDLKIVMMSFIGVVLVIICVKLKSNIKPQPYIGRGTEPVILLNEKLFTNIVDGKTPEDYILYNEIVSYQKRITHAVVLNDKRSERIKEAIDLLYSIPFLSILAFIVFKIISLF